MTKTDEFIAIKNEAALVVLPRQAVGFVAPLLSVEDAAGLKTQNVHGIGVGYKWTKGKQTPSLCIRVYVYRKLAKQVIPKGCLVQTRIDGAPTDVIECPPIQFAARARRPMCSVLRKKRQMPRLPIRPGVSCSHADVFLGTLGAFCHSTDVDDDPETLFALSNNHVMANVNRASKHDPVVQPANYDGGVAPRDSFARLHRFAKLRDGSGEPNLVDAAIAEVLPGANVAPEVCMVGAIRETGSAKLRKKVRKHARTTGETEGVVDDISCDIDVSGFRFIDQIRIAPGKQGRGFADNGDSGAVVTNHPVNDVVGLLFAHADGYGYANHIHNVVTEMRIEII